MDRREQPRRSYLGSEANLGWRTSFCLAGNQTEKKVDRTGYEGQELLYITRVIQARGISLGLPTDHSGGAVLLLPEPYEDGLGIFFVGPGALAIVRIINPWGNLTPLRVSIDCDVFRGFASA